VGGALFLLLSVPDSIGDCGTLASGVGVEHPTLVGCSGGSMALVITSVLYWELEGYEVEHCPTLKKVIYGW
jgi:hypothetical protein